MENQIPVILGVHGQLKFGVLFKDFIEKVYRWSIGTYIYKVVDKIITLSSSDKNFIQRHGVPKEKIEVIPNAIDIEKINSLANKAKDKIDSIIGRYELSRYKFKILFVGPVIKRKGIDTAIKAISLLRKSIPNVILIVTGNGNFLEKAKKMVNKLNLDKNILFTNRVPYLELLALYQIADLVILPSRSEGLPTTLLEALALKKKVIASSLPSIKEYFYNKIPLVNSDDSEALCIAIKSILMESSKYIENIDIQNFDWNIVSQKIENIYNKLVNR